MGRNEPDPTHLATALSRDLGAGTTVANLARLSGGASRETWSFEATDAKGVTRRLVARAVQCRQIAARLHSTDPRSLPEAMVLEGPPQSAQYRDLLGAFGEPHPAFE